MSQNQRRGVEGEAGLADPRVPGGAGPVRVLLIAPSMHMVGGQSVQASRLLEGMGDEEEVHVTFLPMNPPLPRFLGFIGRVKYVRTVVTLLNFLVRLVWLAPRCQIIHVFSASFYSFLLAPAPALLVARLLGRRSILNYRDGRAPIHLGQWRSARLVGLADVIVAPSAYLVDVFRDFGYEARSIFNIINAEDFTFRIRAHPRPRFLHNRSLETLYNVPCALRAFALVQQRYPEAALTIAHDGPLRTELEELVQALRLQNTRFIGKVPQSEIAELYDDADIYLTTPDLDCMPGSVLECYASGLPLVATEAGGIPYIVRDGETGMLAPPNDHEAVAAAALRVLEEEGLAQRLALGGRAELEQYSWERVGAHWLSLYKELLDTPADRRTRAPVETPAGVRS